MIVYGEERVNTHTPNQQQEAEIAVLSGGGYVVVWQSTGQDGSSTGVYGQRFSASGVAIGPEFKVNSVTANAQDYAHVAALSDGGFVVTWQDNDGDGSGYGVIGQRYNAAGVAQGTNFVVNTFTSNTQYQGAVAGYTGGFAVVWTSNTNAGGDSYDIYVKRFDNAGSVIAAETRVSTTPGNPADAQNGNQQVADVAAYANGNLVIVWEDQGGSDGSSYGVYGRTLTAAGVFSDTFLVNTTTAGAQYEASVATLSDGGFIVVWRSDSQDGSSAGVYGQRFNAAGAKVGAEILINESTTGGQYQPAVTGLSTGGFVVTWYNDNFDVSGTGTTSDVYIREFSAAGVATGGQQKLASSTNSTEFEPAIADLGSGNFVVAYSDYGAGTTNTYEIVQHIFGTAAELPRQANPNLADFVGTVTFAENLINATPQVIDPAVSLTDIDSANFGGGRLDLFYTVGGEATDQLGVRNQGVGVGQIGVSGANVSYSGTTIGTISGGANGANLVITLNASATVDAVEALVQNLTYASTSQSPAASRTVGVRVSDGDGGSSTATEFTINVTNELDGAPVVYGEERVNTRTANQQQEAEIAVLSGGGYVVVWQSTGQDGSSTGVYGQRFSASGVAIGPEFKVNSVTANAQDYAHVAALSDGGFVVTWQDNDGDGSGYGVIGQRYNAAGVAQGTNFVVNTFTSNTQYQGAVAGYTGGFAVVWTSNTNAGGDSYDIYVKRFDNAGSVIAAETRVSTTPGNPADAQNGNQQVADVAAYANGNLVIVWEDQGGSDGSSYGVYGRTLTAAGVFSDTFLVNTTTAGAQYEASVATLSDGGFIVVWRSDNQDGSSAGVYGQRFNAAGAKVGAEILINESTTGGQYQPAVTGLSTGGFVVTWYNDNFDVSGTGTTSDVYVREFNAAGAPIDGQRKLASSTNSTEFEPAIADLGSGNFVVAYSDYGAGTTNTYEIVQHIFGTAAELPRQANPNLADFVGTVTFAENLINATPQVIDPAVSLTDIDSANFGGGRLDLFYTVGGEATDQLGVRNQGVGVGQIGVSGANVSYSGTTIGTISGGANGANLVITLNASATVDAVEALVQNLTYASTSQSPAASRTVGVRVSDGDGGSSTATEFTINVTSEIDGVPVVYGEERVNTYTANQQQEADIAVLSGGGYVVVWQSTLQDGSGTGVYAQRFSASGVAIGAEFKANSVTANAQDYAHVAALSDGGFVVTWEDNNGTDGAGSGVIGQRYDAAGVAQGTNFVVNTFTSNTQYQGAVAGYNNGFAVVWTSNTNVGGDSYDIYVRRFDNAGNGIAAETRVSTTPGNPADAQNGNQQVADVAAYANGNLVMVWEDQSGSDGSGYGVYGRTLTAAGVFSDTFLVNTTTESNQYEASVATLSDGGFIVVWRSDSQDGSSAGVYGQRFNAAGTKVGVEFLVNESTTGGQYQPAVTGLSTGGFVVTWYNDNADVSGTGTTSDVYVREFNAAGAPIDGQRKLASSTNSTEFEPAIADLGSGNFVVAYSDYGASTTNSYEIVQQIFGTASELTRPSQNPVLDDFRAQRILITDAASSFYVGNPQLIDADVDVSDADSANFGGGSLIVTLLNSATATETLAVRNQGAGAGQIGVSGANVSYGGTTIGTVSGGGAGGTTLTIALNTSADAAAVRALIENITYQNTAAAAALNNTDRSVGFFVSDGDGGVATEDVVIHIQATISPQQIVLDDVESDVILTEAQAQAGVVLDDAVQVTNNGANSFNNGSLTVSYVSSTGRVDDQLSIQNQGAGANQVGVAGNTVSFGGVAIGTIAAADNGVNGDNLVITFNASATAQSIERVIENLRYANNSDGPNPTRTISIVVRDGANVASTAAQIEIQVTPQEEGVQHLFGEQQVNTYEDGQQVESAVARLSGPNNGGYVIVWQSQDAQDGDSYGVYGQRYAANGSAIGPEFQVNTHTLGQQYQGAVGGLANGGFVVAWTSNSQDGSGYGVYAQRYAADGSKAGVETRVNTTIISTQNEPAVLGLSDGTYIVAYHSDYNNAAANYTYDVLAQRYAADGAALGGEVALNTLVSGQQFQPQLSALSGGGFVAIWTDTSGDASGYGVVAQRFDNTGAKVGGEIPVNTTTTGTQQGPDVAGLAGGGFVAVWHYNSDIYAQRFDAAGAKVGAEITVNTDDSPANQSSSARVAALESGGFAVLWDGHPSVAMLGGSSQDVVMQQFDASGNKVDGPTIVNTTRASTQYQPDVAALTGSNLVVTWSGYDQERASDNSYGIFHQILGTAGSLARSAAPVLFDVGPSVTFVENTVNAAPQIIDPGVNVTDTDSANFDGGRLWVSTISGYGDIAYAQLPEDIRAQDQLGVRNQGSAAGQIGVSGSSVTYGGVTIATIEVNGANGTDLVVRFNAAATQQAVESLIENLTYANTASAPNPTRTISISVSDGDGATSEPRTVTINVTPSFDGAQPLFANEQVNSYEPGTQGEPAMARLSDGGYVTVWSSEGQDGWSTGIYGQRYSTTGTPVGSEFQIHTYTPNQQESPTVAGLGGGGFVVAWQSNAQDGSSWGVYAQRFDTNGIPVGPEFRVNTTTGQGQYQPAMAATSDGGFVVAWYYDYYNAGFTELGDIFFQRYNAAGVAQGGETRANQAGLGNIYQYEPSIAGLTGGGFVIVWRSDSQDGSSAGVYGQRFTAAGAASGPEFRVNTFTDGNQYEPDIAALAGGGFVVVWRSDGQDGSSAGVFGQRYNAAGVAVGTEFRVNTDTSGNEYQPSVSGLPSGGFVVSWNDDSRTFVQQFDANGGRIDDALRADTNDANNTASQPDVLALDNGAFVTAWQDYDYTQNNYQVLQQLFGAPANFPRQTNPELVDVTPSVTFAENTINVAPQVIDSGVGLFDPDSPNFAGGILEVNYLTDYGSQDQLGQQGLGAQDQLGIRNQGAGVGEIGVAGNTVSYGGTAIGTIVSNGANGVKLTVQFNANATPEAVEHVIENITYANSASNPIASRTVSIRVTDGDGGASDARNVVINVTPEIDGAVPRGLERIVNTTVAGGQHEPAVARLADGGYVVVWEDQAGADGGGYGVYGQRYDADDNPAGGQFLVNTQISSNQYEPQVVGLNGGGFVVTWRSDSQDGSGAGIYAQRYTSNGATAGTEFRVNTTTQQNQYQPAITATADGGFAVAWYYDYYNAAFTELGDIFFQRYNASGVAQGSETRANPAGQGTIYQSEPSIAGLVGGGFVTVWTDASQDGSGAGIFGQRFTAAGVAAGAAFSVNSHIDGAQDTPSVAALTGGGFVVVWESSNQDLSSLGVYGQRFDAAGAKVGAEFRVNTTISGGQYQPSVTGLTNGGWAVTWYSDNPGDVYMQQYNAAGQQIDGETRVNAYTYSTQYQPAIASMPDGGFVVAYAGYHASHDSDGNGIPDGGNDTFEIRLQRFSNTAPDISDVSASGQEEVPLILPKSLFDAGFNDPDGQTLQAIRITTLPASGTLRLDGVAVTPGQEISGADLLANRLVYTGNPDFFGLDQFRWTGSDGITFATNPVFTNITLSNVNDGPRLEAGVNDTGSEGTTFNHTITINDPDPESHVVTVNWGDGTANSVFTTSSNNPNIQHVYADQGNYTVGVTVNDQQGLANSIENDSFSVTIANVAPTISLSGANNVQQGEVYTLTLGFPNDPGADTVTEYRINWGDGTAVQIITAANLPANRQVTHTFAASGNPTIGVTLVDEDGTFANAGTKSITVSAPTEVITVDAGADIGVNEGAFFSKNITFTDPTDQGAAGRSYTVAWGDGQTSNGSIGAGQSSFNINHTYADGAANYDVTVTVDDSGAQQGSDTFNVIVNNVASTVALGGNGSVNEGSIYTLTLTPTDPGTDTISQYVIHWGDGTNQTIAAANLPANGQVTHTYADGNQNLTITVDVTDEDGAFNTAGTRTVFVNNVAPTAAVTGADTVAEGSAYTLNVGAVVEPGTDTRTGYSINWGDGVTTNLTPAQWAAAAGVFAHTYADGGTGGTARTVTVSATDEDGTFTLGTKSLTVNNVAPTAVLGGAASINEGGSYALSITGSDAGGASDTLTYQINWGDGSATQTVTAAQLAAASGVVNHTFADDQDGPVNATLRSISVTVSDEDGGSSSANRDVTVNNVAPTIALGGAATATAGQSYTLDLGTITDPGTDTVTSYIIDWNDGSALQTVTTGGNVTHIYTGTGNRTIDVDLVDEDGTHLSAGTKAVTVSAATPTVSLEAGANASLLEGATFTRTIAFSDGADNGAAGWTYSIDYGDGTVVNGSTLVQSIDLSHLYADGNATRTVAVSVTDVTGESASDSFQVTVDNVAPTAAVTGADTVAEGSAYTLNVGAVVEPGTDTRTGYSINWGDGVTTNLTPAQWAAAAGVFAHTYADGGTGGTARTVTVSATDEDGTFTLGTKSLTVNNVAPTAVLGGAASINEGGSYALSITGSDAGGASDTLTYQINWGDGSATQTVTAAQLAAASGVVNHTFADDQDGPVNATLRSISVTVSDEDGGSSSANRDVTVNNVAPTAAVTGADTVAEGSAYTLNVGAVVEPGTDTRTGYSINWGDGVTTNLTPAQWAAAAGVFAHTYADGGTGGTARTVTVSATDEDGTFTLGTKSLTVNNVAPTAVLGGAASINEGGSYALSITGSDAGGASDTLTYQINWGDGSATQTVTAAQLAAASGVVNHTFADDQDGPVNATLRSISVTVSDEDGGSSSANRDVTVNNVAPTIALGGAATATAGQSYTLDLGAITDPGTDTVTSYIIDWNDGSALQTVTTGGNVTHIYTGTGNRTIDVDLVDEDGTHLSAGTKAVTVSAATPTVSLEAGANASLLEGATFTRTIAFSDGADNGAAGWTYSIDYGDGTVVNGSTLVQSIDLSHLYADGNATRTVAVSVTDVTGESASDSFQVTVNNVAPTAAVTGADTVAEGSAYTLNVGAVVEPGTDTRTGYSINWGDGVTTNLTPAQWAAAAGVFAHTYADGGTGGTARTVTVSATDEDGTFTLGTKSLTVNNVAPTAVLGGAASINEGGSYALSITGSDAGGASDTLTYQINWGDGSATQTVTAAQLAAASGVVNHTFADDQDGPVNATLRSISVTVSDEDGGSSSANRDVTVNNVAPTIALGGAATATAGQSYTLDLGAITDPGMDTVTSYIIDWNDGSALQTVTTGGNVTHIYTGTGNRTIDVDLVDEDGTHLSAGTKAVTVSDGAEPETIKIGDAPARLTSANPNAWAQAWTHADVSITHKADYANGSEAWSAVTLQNTSPLTLPGGDVYLGDLGVSGQRAATSVVRQEIDGTEALRFQLTEEASSATVDLTRFYLQDDGLTFAEAGRLQAFDEIGNLVGEKTFTANRTSGNQQVTLDVAQGFHTLVVTAGVYNGTTFVAGGYATPAGAFGSAPLNSNGTLHGSDFLIDTVEFELLPVGTAGPLDNNVF